MGKQSRLKQVRREGKEVKKEPVYNMTQTQLNAYVNREILKFKKELAEEVTTKVISTLLIQCFDVLHNVFGFGSLRLKRFRFHIDKASELISDLTKEEPDFDYCSDIIQNLEGCRIDVDSLLKGNIDEHSLRRRCDMEKLCPKVADFPFERGNNSGKEKAKDNK